MAMAKFTVDTTAKLFIAKPTTSAFDVRVDLFSDAKEHWIDDDTANKHTFPLLSVGGNPIEAPTKYIPAYIYLTNGWRVRPREASHTLNVTGGVLLVDGGGDPFVDTLGAYVVRILYEQPVQAIAVNQGAVIAPTQQQIRDAATLAPTVAAVADSLDAKLDRNADLVESQRGLHTFQGSIFYVDGIAGNDTTGDGSRALPFKTITKAHTLCTAFAHDMIYLLAPVTGATNVITEPATVVLNKAFTFIRGPGRDVEVKLVGTGDVFDIQDDGVELSGMRITVKGGGKSGVTVSGADVVGLRNLWIENPPQDGIEIKVGRNCIVEHCHLYGAGRSGVRVSSGAGAGYYTRILDNLIRDCTSNGVDLRGTDASNCIVQRNVIRDNGAGVNISAGTADTVVTDNRFVNNAGGDVVDAGTGTLNEWNVQEANTSAEIANAVWNALTAGFSAPGSFGELVNLGLSPTQLAMVLDLWRRHGLDPANPLVSDRVAATIDAGPGLSQSISTAGDVDTITRAP